MRLAFQGAALFAFIPLVLFLYLQHPLGPGLSVGLGMALMFGHRLVAAPWMAAHASNRCLWCGRALRGEPAPLTVRSSGTERRMAACNPDHRSRSARFLAFVFAARVPIALGIFVPLLILLSGGAALALGRPFISQAANLLQFRTVVALTVVGASVGYLAFGKGSEPVTSPFPLHNLFLLGIRNTLWVFRVVGLWWLASSTRALVGLLR